MGWNLVWALCDALFSHSCVVILSRVKFVNTTETETIQYLFIVRNELHSLNFKFYCSDFFRRHRKYRVTLLQLITELVSDYLLKTMSKTTLILVKMSWSAMWADMRRRRYYLVRSTQSYLTFNEVRQSKTTKDKDNSNNTVRQYTAEPLKKMNMNILKHFSTNWRNRRLPNFTRIDVTRVTAFFPDRQELRIIEGTTHEKHWLKTTWSVIDVSRRDLDSIATVRQLSQKRHIMKRYDNYCKRCGNYVSTTQVKRRTHHQMQLHVVARTTSRIIGGAQEISLEWRIAAVVTKGAS